MRDLWLASASPRRLQLLEEAGFRPKQIVSPHDDDQLPAAGAGVEATCVARAWFKAMAAGGALRAKERTSSENLQGILLAADTLCALDDVLLGKPTDPAEAEAMIRQLAGKEHKTVTGVALLEFNGGWRSIWFDTTRVRVGALSTSQVDDYIRSEQWRGKSGGYNLADRLEAGWPIEYDGDPGTVMGLPMRRLSKQLKTVLVEPVT